MSVDPEYTSSGNETNPRAPEDVQGWRWPHVLPAEVEVLLLLLLVVIPPLIGCYRRLPFHLPNLLKSRGQGGNPPRIFFQEMYEKTQMICTGRHAVGLVGA